jgi:hypothetical protein
VVVVCVWGGSGVCVVVVGGGGALGTNLLALVVVPKLSAA